MSEAKYKRVLLKLSGEALAGAQKTGVNPEVVGKICDKIKEVVEMGVEVAIVVGGGHFWRGRQGLEMERTTAEYMGVLWISITRCTRSKRNTLKSANCNRNERNCRTIYTKKS